MFNNHNIEFSQSSSQRLYESANKNKYRIKRKHYQLNPLENSQNNFPSAKKFKLNNNPINFTTNFNHNLPSSHTQNNLLSKPLILSLIITIRK